MPVYCLRGPATTAIGTGTPAGTRANLLVLYLFLRRVVGYDYVDHTGTVNFETIHSQSGNDGVLTNTDYTFVSATATFSGASPGQLLCIRDTANPENSGVFRIDTYIDPNTVGINFCSGSFPTAASNLEWWLADPTNMSAVLDLQGVVLQGNHATAPFQVYIHNYWYSSAGTPVGIGVRVAGSNTAWNVATHTWDVGAPLLTYKWIYHDNNVSTPRPRLYGVADTEFSHAYFVSKLNNGTGGESTVSWYVVNPVFEVTRNPSERLVISGQRYTAGGTPGRSADAGAGVDYGHSWSSVHNRDHVMYWCGWRDESQDFFKRAFTLPNHREGTEYDGLPIWVQCNAAYTVVTPNWGLLGEIPKDRMWLAAIAGIGNIQTFTTHQYMHWIDGVVTNWCGVDLL